MEKLIQTSIFPVDPAVRERGEHTRHTQPDPSPSVPTNQNRGREGRLDRRRAVALPDMVMADTERKRGRMSKGTHPSPHRWWRRCTGADRQAAATLVAALGSSGLRGVNACGVVAWAAAREVARAETEHTSSGLEWHSTAAAEAAGGGIYEFAAVEQSKKHGRKHASSRP
jgi:hypothetical protein